MNFLSFVKLIRILLIFFVLYSASAYAKIYDCFCFNNEFEILKIRLEELWDSVDYFVLVESIETQRGHPKPLYFQENKQVFDKYLSKIIHIAVEERHPEFGLWQREHYQRNCMTRGLTQCSSKDIIIISDVDEIPRRKRLPEFFAKLHSRAKSKRINGVSLQQTIYFYQLNRRTPTGETWGGGPWVGTVITTYKDLLKANPQHFRSKRRRFPIISNAGWHFTWMGGIEKVREKMGSVVEGNDNANQYSDDAIAQWFLNHPAVPLDASFPQYVLENADYLKSIGYIAEVP